MTQDLSHHDLCQLVAKLRRQRKRLRQSLTFQEGLVQSYQQELDRLLPQLRAANDEGFVSEAKLGRIRHVCEQHAIGIRKPGETLAAKILELLGEE